MQSKKPHQMKYHENDIKRVRSTDLVQRDASKSLLDKFGDVRTGKFENWTISGLYEFYCMQVDVWMQNMRTKPGQRNRNINRTRVERSKVASVRFVSVSTVFLSLDFSFSRLFFLYSFSFSTGSLFLNFSRDYLASKTICRDLTPTMRERFGDILPNW